MRSIRSMLPVLVAAAVIHTGCTSTVYRSADVLADSEDRAIAKLGDDIDSQSIRLLNKKVGVFYFTTLDWTASAPGNRISGKLSDYLEKTGKLRIVPRSELDRMIKREVTEQSGMYEVEFLKKKAGTISLDYVIYGTVDNAGDAVDIMVRMVDVKTGRWLLVTGVRMPVAGEFTGKVNPDLLLLNRKSPQKVIAMNKTYHTLAWLKTRQPLVFLLVVLKDEEVKSLVNGPTLLGSKLKVRKERYRRDRPDVIEKIGVLKDGLALINRYAPQRASDIARWKKNLLNTAGR